MTDCKLKVIPANAPPGGGWAATYVGNSSPLNDIRLNMEQPDYYTNCINPANPIPPPPHLLLLLRANKKMVSVISSRPNQINVNSGFFSLFFFSSTVASALTGSCEESGHLTALSLSSAQPRLQSHLQNISSDSRVKRLIQAFILPCLEIMCNFRWECWL